MTNIIVFIFLLTINLTKGIDWLQCGVGKYQDPLQTVCQQCNSSCFDCAYSQGNQSQTGSPFCLSCKDSFYYNNLNGQCQDICPSNSRKNNALHICETCVDQNCNKCDSSPSVCMECMPNFSLVDSECQINIEIVNESSNSISKNFVNEIECTNLIDTSLNFVQNLIQFSFFDQDFSSLFVIATNKVYKYDILTLELLQTGSFPYNGFVRDCGFYQADLDNFYCTARPNFLIQYNRNLLNQTLVTTFTGFFPNYANLGGGFPTAYFGRLYQRYYTGLITSFLVAGVEVYSFETKSKVLYSITSTPFNNQNYAYLKDLQGFLFYDQSRDQVLFKNNPTSENLIIKGQTGYLYAYDTLDSNNILLLHKYGANVCDTSLLMKNQLVTLASQCFAQSTPWYLIKYAFPSINANYQQDQLLVMHQNVYGLLLIYDYSQGPQQVNLAFGKLNYTQNYQYVGQRSFIHLNMNYQLSLITINAIGQSTEILTPPIIQYIFQMNFAFQFLPNRIILMNSKQVIAVKYQLNPTSDQSSALNNFQQFISQDNNNFEIIPVFAEEPLLNYDYIIKAFYDSNLELYIFIKYSQIRIKYKSSHLYGDNEKLYNLEQNSGQVFEAEYIQSLQKLIVATYTEQIILSIPDLKLIRRDKSSIIGERWHIYYNNNQVISCAVDKNYYIQYFTTNLLTNTFFASQVYMQVQDFFFGYDKFVILNNTDIYSITLSNQETVTQKLSFTITFDTNIFYSIGSINYIAIYQKLTIPKMHIYNLNNADLSNPSQIITYPNVVATSQMFDYYQSTYSLYTVQSDGIYTYELDSNNVFVQKSYFANTQIKSIRLQPKFPGSQSFSKVIVFTNLFGVVTIDKVIKTFSLINTQVQIQNIFFLINSLNVEYLILQNLSQTRVYSLINNSYKVIQSIQGACLGSVKLLDTSEIFCPQPLKNDTFIFPVHSFLSLSLSSYAIPLVDVQLDSTQKYLAVNIQNKLIKVLNQNNVQEQVVLQYQSSNNNINFLFYDQNQQILLFIENSISLYSYKSGQSNPTLLITGNNILWYFIVQDKQIILLHFTGTIYSINYITGQVAFTTNLSIILITTPVTTPIISTDRIDNYVYVYISKARVIKFSITEGQKAILSLSTQEVFMSGKRVDKNILVFTNQVVGLYSGDTLTAISTKQFTTLIDSFKVYHISDRFVFCQPLAIQTGYFIDVNSLDVFPIVFRSLLYAVDFDQNTNRIVALTNDNILSIYDLFNQSNPTSFILQEFSDDLLQQQQGSNQSIAINLNVLFSLDCAIFTQAQQIYIYSISKQIILNIIRSDTNASILNFWITEDNSLVYYDENGIYYYNLYQIVQLQPRFHSSRYLFNEVFLHNKLINNNPIGLVETISNQQLKSYNNSQGTLSKSYQLRKTYMSPIQMNSKLLTSMVTSNSSKILIRQNTIYVLDSQNIIINSLNIPSMNAMAPITQNALQNNIIFIINYDRSIIKADLSTKQYQTLQVTLSNVLFISELTDISLIFQYNDVKQQNDLTCLNSKTLVFTDMTDSLLTFNINKVFKDFQKYSNNQIITSTKEGYLYILSFNGCSFSANPSLIINQIFSFYFYDPNLKYLLVLRESTLTLDLIQNNQLIASTITLPSSNSKIKVSDDSNYYIIYSKIFVYIFNSNDLKLRVKINYLFTQSEIRDIILISSDFLLVVTNTDIFSFYLVQDKYYLTLTYSIELPIILSYLILKQSITTSLAFADLSIFSLQGIIKLNIPIFSNLSNSSRKCYYKLNLDSQNQQKDAPVVSDKIKYLSYLNQKNQNIQVVGSIIFTLGDNESLQKLTTIPSKVNTLVIDSNKIPNKGSIIIDQNFQIINIVSNNVLLQNIKLIFQESSSSDPVINPQLSISNKNIVYLQNIDLIGYRKSYYFTLNSNQLFRVENLQIINFQIDQIDNSQLAIFNIDNTQTIFMKNLVLQDLQLSKDLTLFNIRNAKEIIVDNFTIQNINCKNLIIFNIGSSIELKINKLTIKNVECQYFQLIESFLITNLSMDGILISDVTMQSAYHTIVVQSVFNFSVKDFEITKCKGLKAINIQQYSKDNTNYAVNVVNINNLKINQSQDFIQQQVLRNLQNSFTNDNTQMISINDCQSLAIVTLIIDQIVLQSNNFISFNSKTIDINNLFLTGITTNNQDISIITFDGDDLILKDFNYLNTQNILLSISNFNKFDLLQSNIKNNLVQTQQQINGLLSCLQIKQLTIVDSNFENNKIYKPAKGILNIYNVNKFEISNSIFNANESIKSGGSCLYIVNTQVSNISQLRLNPSKLNKCKFISNQSISDVGGAIFIQDQNIEIKDSQFLQNKALIGGAIKISSLNILPDFFIDSLQNKSNNNLFINNLALLYGENIGYFPQKVKAIYNKNIEYKYGEKIEILNFQSNNYFDNLILYIIDNEGKQVNFPTESLNLENENLQQEFLKYQFAIDQKMTQDIFVSQSQIMLTNFQYFLFNATFITSPKSVNQLTIKSSGTVPTIKIDQSGFSVAQLYLEVQLVIHSRDCQRGDYLSKINNLVYCIPCPQGQYSLDIPDLQSKDKVLTCKYCPTSTISCSGNQISLKNGYWREDEFTDKIYKCNDSISSCLPEDPNSKDQCGIGYVGPLCETCDTLGTVWGEKYSYNSVKICAVCSQPGLQAIVLLGFLVLSAGYLICIVFQNIRCSQNKILRQFTEKIIGISLGSSIDLTRNSALIKILMNFFQIYLILDGSGFQLPHQTQQVSFLGDPTSNLVTSVDCLFDYKNSKSIVMYRIIFKLLSIATLFVICLVAIVIQFKLDKSKSKKFAYKMVYASMILKVIFLYGGFGIVTDAVKALSCIQIGSKRYRLFDKRIECSSDISQDTNIYVLASLVVIAIAIIIPSLLFIQIKKFTTQNKTESIHVLKSYNFLFQEYRSQAVYWELVKIMLKYLIIFVINFFESDLYSKIQLTLLFLVGYNVILLKVQPYKSKFLNRTDLHSMFTCQITLICSTCILSTNNELISFVLIVITIIINFFFLILTLLQFIKGLRIQIDQQSNNPFKIMVNRLILKISPILQIQAICQTKRFRSLKLWMLLKRKIVKNEDNIFMEYLKRRVQENRLYEKQFNLSNILQQTQSKQQKVPTQFKLDLQSPIKLNQQSGQFILPTLIQDQEEANLNLKDKQQSLISHCSYSPKSIITRIDQSERNLIFLRDYPTQGDEVKLDELKRIEDQQTQQNDEKCQVTEESQDEHIRVYRSSISPNNYNIFHSHTQQKEDD